MSGSSNATDNIVDFKPTSQDLTIEDLEKAGEDAGNQFRDILQQGQRDEDADLILDFLSLVTPTPKKN